MLQALESIDRVLLARTTGGGPSLGDRENPSAPPLERTPPMFPQSSFEQSAQTWGGMDAGMERQPANPSMDMGMSMSPMSLGAGGGALDI